MVDANILTKDLAKADIHLLIVRELPMNSDTSEKGLERLICTALTGAPCDPGTAQADMVREPGAPYGGSGWIGGSPDD